MDVIIPVSVTQGKIIRAESEIEQLTFKDLGITESQIEEFIRTNIDVLFDQEESMLIVGQQVSNDAKGRCDLVAIDGEGNLVLIEIKRDLAEVVSRREPMEFQAIRYAANYAQIKTVDEMVAKLFTPYITRHSSEFDGTELTPLEKAKRIISEFLKRNDSSRTFNRRQRIVLIASGFDSQTLSACAWLINNGVDMSCFTVEPAKYNGHTFLTISRLLPPDELSDFYVGVPLPSSLATDEHEQNTLRRTSLPTMPQLFEWGIVSKGDVLTIKGFPDSEATVIDHRTVMHNTRKRSFNQWGKRVTGWSSINIYQWAISTRHGELLDVLRRRKLAELETEQVTAGAPDEVDAGQEQDEELRNE